MFLRTAVGAFILYGALYAMTGSQVYGIGNFFSTYYIDMSDLPGICPDLPGSAGYAVFPDTDPDEMDGTSLRRPDPG